MKCGIDGCGRLAVVAFLWKGWRPACFAHFMSSLAVFSEEGYAAVVTKLPLRYGLRFDATPSEISTSAPAAADDTTPRDDRAAE